MAGDGASAQPEPQQAGAQHEDGGEREEEHDRDIEGAREPVAEGSLGAAEGSGAAVKRAPPLGLFRGEIAAGPPGAEEREDEENDADEFKEAEAHEREKWRPA